MAMGEFFGTLLTCFLIKSLNSSVGFYGGGGFRGAEVANGTAFPWTDLERGMSSVS